MEHQDRTSRVTPADQPSTMHDAAPVTPDPDVEGTVLAGRYRVEECLGAGAMGVVWSAWDRRLRRTVAVKQLTPPRDGDETEIRAARARAMREGRIAARVVHSRAIAVFDVVMHGSMPWIVMEYLPSRSLAAVLAERGPLPPAEVARIGAQIADALSAVHEAGIVHGDVKPGNVLITDDGVAKLTDFGVSRASWDTTATGGGLVAGTPGYFAPEVARGGDPTPASDVFSLGATLYAAVENELVCGRLDNTLAVLHAMAEGRLRPAARAGVLGRPLSAMLRLDARHRPDTALLRSALEARAALGEAEAALPAPAAVPAPGPTPAEPGDPSTADVAGRRPGAGGPPTSPDGSGAGAPGTPDDGTADASGRDWFPLAPPTGAHTPTAPTRPRPRRRRRVLAVAAASAVVLAAGVGAALAAADHPRTPGPQATVAAPAPVPTTEDAPVAPSTETVPPVAGAPLSPGSPSADTVPAGGDRDAPVTEDDTRRTVTAYYASLPGNIPGAWALLSGDARQASGGYGGYERFWGGITSVSADDVQVDGTSARAVLEFVTSSGRTTRETYSFQVDRNDQGALEIRSASRGAADSA
ncbi:serine/threonine-protein kinase [Actinomycetospora soli]|uniref:serine/threonine-protein kinase n=1 Tax=Actinomycetospora soli TaxID=2893887 RepID=UPI001E4B488F|nr:serine/threonine-protein kinase [Actinomycetospora soli]MCD2187493.1 protein kinase [Actinomycetospora soli]